MSETGDGPITREEMNELFGEEMPMVAVKLLWTAPGDMTIRELRHKLRQLAAAAKVLSTSPADR